jgi:DNA topoisomerase-1
LGVLKSFQKHPKLTELADAPEAWWTRLSREEKQAYIKEHPHSKYAGYKSNSEHGPASASPHKGPKPVPTPATNPKPLEKQPRLVDKDDVVKQAKQADAKPKPAPKDDPELPGSGSHKLESAPEDKANWPDHIKALKLPPAWTDVKISHDPNSSLQAIGKDAKGRAQYVYSQEFARSQSAAKFRKIHELEGKLKSVERQNVDRMHSEDPRVAEHAQCMHLVMRMGLRPGGETDTKADKKAYGASTLEGRHVVRGESGKIHLRFVGKKSMDLDLQVPDAQTASILEDAAKRAGSDGKLFPRVSAQSLLEYSHSLDGGHIKTKDFRTLKATTLAHKLVNKLPAPTNEKDYRKQVMAVAKHVSKVLGNTPTVALCSYISPAVFGSWQESIGMKPETASDTPKPKVDKRLPNVHFGKIDGSSKTQAQDHDPDDDTLPRKLPLSFIKLLGFDPRKVGK